MKFTLGKSKAKKMIKLLGLNFPNVRYSSTKPIPYVMIQSTHGKIVSGQVGYGKNSSISNCYRYAEFDSAYFREISYDYCSRHMFMTDHKKLYSVISKIKSKTLQFEYPNPETGGLRISAPPIVKINLVTRGVKYGEYLDLPLKMVGGIPVLKDGTRLDTCVVFRKKWVKKLKAGCFVRLRFVVDENEVKICLAGDNTEVEYRPEHIIKTCVKPVDNFYDVDAFLMVLKTLENNPTIYLAQDSPAWIVNNMEDHRIGFLIPPGK